MRRVRRSGARVHRSILPPAAGALRCLLVRMACMASLVWAVVYHNSSCSPEHSSPLTALRSLLISLFALSNSSSLLTSHSLPISPPASAVPSPTALMRS